MMSSLNLEMNVYGVWFLMTVLSFPWICEYNNECLFSCSGLPEECKVQTPAFTDAVRLYRQAHGHYGTWDMMCGTPPQVKQKPTCTCIALARSLSQALLRLQNSNFLWRLFEFIKCILFFSYFEHRWILALLYKIMKIHIGKYWKQIFILNSVHYTALTFIQTLTEWVKK